MSQRFFLIQSGIPPERWVQAFPAGMWCPPAKLTATLQAGAVVWVPTVLSRWEERVRTLLAQHPGTQVVVASPVPEDSEGLRAIQAGARAYCHLQAVPGVLQEVDQVVRHGGLWVGPDLVLRLMRATQQALSGSPSAPLPEVDLSVLSERERQVALAVAEGRSNREVAQSLFISERTVKAHLGAVFEKLGVRDRVQMVLQLSASQRPARNDA
jgi:DNA-binding NarL/FixJ family response regulator